VAGGLLGHVLVQAMGDPAITLIGVVVGVVLGAILALLIFRIMIILTTSVVGANMAVIGALALLLHVTSIAEPLRRWLGSTHYMLPLLVAVPAFVGVVYQLYRTESKGKKEPGTAKEEE
jgi:Mg2+/Co2+ transporter CorB